MEINFPDSQSTRLSEQPQFSLLIFKMAVQHQPRHFFLKKKPVCILLPLQ